MQLSFFLFPVGHPMSAGCNAELPANQTSPPAPLIAFCHYSVAGCHSPRRSIDCHNSSPPLSYFLFTTHDSAIEEISETALIQPSLALAPSLALCYAMLCFWSTDIVVKQTGREGCLHTVEIQTEIQV